MNNLIPIKNFLSEHDPLETINISLQNIQNKFVEELTNKQALLVEKEQEIHSLRAALNFKDNLIEELKLKTERIERNNEGNKQLNKKLINELVRKQQDIEWYKRTYETRSFLGTIKQKVLKRFF